MRRVRRRWSRDWNRFIILNGHERFTPGALEHPAIGFQAAWSRTICQLRTKTMGEHRLQREGKNEPAITSIVMLPSLVIEKPCAAVADLSPAKRAAVIECFNNRGLHKCNGYWCGPPEGKHISGVTVADLARDGVLTVIKNLRHGSAQLTERGQWFARTLIAAAN